MEASRLAVRVPRTRAEEVRRMLLRQGLYDGSRSIVESGDSVLMPVLGYPQIGFEVVEADLPASKRPRPVSMRAAFDIVGDIAVLNDMDLSPEKAHELALEIVGRHRRVRTVLQKTAEVSGEERVASYRVVYGEADTETVHRESGCLFKLDVARTFFSPRLSGERLRVASQVGEGETVLDMFAGVGPFSIIIARRNPSATVYAVEKNPAAFKYLCENIELNKLRGRVKPFQGDAAQTVPALDTNFNRIIMNLPHSSTKYLPAAVEKAAEKATIHLYVVEDRKTPGSARQAVESSLRNLQIVGERTVKEVSPKALMRVYDIKVGGSSL
ncbi:MAG: class I SAM-dependent methyltransferase family protein [Candidatus Caldarchaeum sp.]|nr:class I SAM-dependent methyltransferase family protein [Candidatus Caldarchaeum sp.]